MTKLACFPLGRILLHLLAMLGHGAVRFHIAGILREARPLANVAAFLAQMPARILQTFLRYLTRPLKPCTPFRGAAPPLMPEMLHPGDVLLSEGNTRAAVIVKRVTRSTWSHVSMYVGPLDDGPDPRCIVEADMAAGVRSIRLSELDAVNVRVLRPAMLNDIDRCRLADWIVSQIGSKYDVKHAFTLAFELLRPSRLPLFRTPSCITANSTTRFICCSLLAHAFATVECPIVSVEMGGRFAASADHRRLTPGDFERAPVFEVIALTNQA